MPHQASLLVQIGIPGLAVAVALLLLLGIWRSAALPGASRGADSADGERRSCAATAAARRDTVRVALGVAGLFTVSSVLSLSGVLADATRRPPPLMLLVAATMAITVAVALSPQGGRIATRLPLWALVGAQAFRLPLELVMRQAARDGVMP